ncbi:hypothetical protein HanIR_Chr02g0083211 [Helianthus annuus]|nr:hypothetical protein HanIR_Chr02g0083211 [Helianthus annuus]
MTRERERRMGEEMVDRRRRRRSRRQRCGFYDELGGDVDDKVRWKMTVVRVFSVEWVVSGGSQRRQWSWFSSYRFDSGPGSG